MPTGGQEDGREGGSDLGYNTLYKGGAARDNIIILGDKQNDEF